MKPLTIGAAARLCGKSKATISRAISSGKLSASRQGNGYAIDPSELARVFPWNTETVAEAPQRNEKQPPNVTPIDTSETVELIELRVKLEAAQQRIADLQEDRDHWRQQANRLLSSPPNKEEQPKGFWKRLFG